MNMKDYDLKNIHEWPLAFRIIVITFICGAVFYAAYFLDFSSINRQKRAGIQQEADLKIQLESILSKEVGLQSDLSQLTTLDAFRSKWRSHLTTPDNFPELLNEVLKIGSGSGLQFNLFNPAAETSDGPYSKMPINIVAIGNYNQLATFFSQIANMPAIVVIGNFTIMEPDPNLTTDEMKALLPGQLLVQITLEIYYLNGKPVDEKKVAT